MANHPLIEELVSLAKTDLAILNLQRELIAEKQALQAAKGLLQQEKEALLQANQRIEELQKRDRALQRKLETYNRQQASANRILEQGLGNPIAAEKQFKQCASIIDDIETELLEVMDCHDQAITQREHREQQVSHADSGYTTLATNSPETRTALTNQKNELSVSRKHAVSQLDRDILNRYEQLRRAKGTAVASIRTDCCRACQMSIPMQDLSDVRRGLIVHCRRCGRWLFENNA